MLASYQSWRKTIKDVNGESHIDFRTHYVKITKNKLKKLLIWIIKPGRTQHHKHTNCTWLLISNCNNVSDMLLIISYFLHYLWLQVCSFSNKLKQTYEKAKKLFNPAKTHFLSEESLKEKRHTCIGMCSLFTQVNKQVLNLCHRWHRCIHNSSKTTLCYIFDRVLSTPLDDTSRLDRLSLGVLHF